MDYSQIKWQHLYMEFKSLLMPPKKRRLEKRKKRDHPKVEQYMAVAQLATILANLTKQEQQYIALLKQVADVTEHEARVPEKQWFIPTFSYSEDQAGDILDYVQRWLKTIVEHSNGIREKRDRALEKIRQLDVLDNESLKQAAMELTEAESQCAVIQQVQKRWSKIVRCEKDNGLQEHTAKWLKRWLVQWRKLNAMTQKRLDQFRESLKASLLHDAIAETHSC